MTTADRKLRRTLRAVATVSRRFRTVLPLNWRAMVAACLARAPELPPRAVALGMVTLSSVDAAPRNPGKALAGVSAWAARYDLGWEHVRPRARRVVLATLDTMGGA